jgi:hypothetical protein
VRKRKIKEMLHEVLFILLKMLFKTKLGDKDTSAVVMNRDTIKTEMRFDIQRINLDYYQ